MSLAREIVRQDAAPGVSVANTPDALSAIHRPDCAAAIWRRRLSPGLLSWIGALPPDQLPKARVILRPDDVREATGKICEESGTPDGPERDMLTADTAALAETFADLMRAPYLRLRYDVIDTNACRKFHIDTVTARLICTYRGPGTQYGTARNGADPSRVFAVTAGSPILLRGRLWPERPDAGLRHRSPPIEGTGQTRLLLVLDPVQEPEEEAERITIG